MTVLEVFYDLPYDQLSVEKQQDGTYKASFRIDVDVKNVRTGEKKSDTWVSSAQMATEEEAKVENASGVDQFEIELRPGTYDVTVAITDLTSNKKGTTAAKIELPQLGSSLSLSDVQLATSVVADTVGSTFTRGNLRAIPNARRVFGDNLPLLFSRFEIYNMEFDSANPGVYVTAYSILNEKGETVNDLPPARTEKLGHTGVEVGAVNVLGLAPGKYSLQVAVTDSSSGQSAKSVSSFDVAALKARKPPMQPWAVKYFDRIDLLVGQDSTKFMKSLSKEGQQQFLVDFWLRRDPTPGTRQNEYFNDFAERVKQADEMFSSGLEHGVNSDRGRIYIKYGKPDDVERYPADPDYPAHEDWFYYKESGIQFIFSDLSGIGKYKLIYSSTEAENTIPNWSQYIDSQYIKKLR
jgi:GWxTD domain-containing protein